jgi:sugar phosphate isomerase/epimerase
MSKLHGVSRRTFLGAAAVATLAQAKATVPVGLELYSVRGELKTDLSATLNSVSKMGYECVEFFSSYVDWTTDYAKQVRKQLNDLGMKCYSTHNGPTSFAGDGLAKAIELNKILGSKYIVMASAGKESSLDDWKRVAETLNQGNDKMRGASLHAGYHNHAAEWKPVEGQKPMEILAKNTGKDVMLQLDVGTCVESGSDPVAWIESNPGRIRSLHLKDWSPDKDYKVLFGEGVAPWKKILTAAESTGGVEFYLIEQEGSRFPELETAERCLVSFHELRG